MITLLAESDSTTGAASNALTNLFQSVTTMFSHGDALAQPQVVVDQLKALGVVWAVVFMIVGVLCMLNGYKFYRLVTIGLALMLGSFVGYYLGAKIHQPFIVAACLGVLLAVVAFPLMKYAVAVFGGLAGAFLGANLWSGLAHAINSAGTTTTIPPNAYWIGALVGLLVCGMLAFVLFRLAVVLFTSVSGSTIAVLGVIALLLSFKPWQATVSQGLTGNQVVIPLLVFVPAVVALILQHMWYPAEKADESD